MIGLFHCGNENIYTKREIAIDKDLIAKACAISGARTFKVLNWITG